MKISTSILSIHNNIQKIKAIDALATDYIHLDVMDGKFVTNKVDFHHLINLQRPLDVHLMVQDIKMYVDTYASMCPTYITFHWEAVTNVMEMIQYIRQKNIKVGISIKPQTSVEVLEPYLDMTDLVLVMTVEPGAGGQKFIKEMQSKIDWLRKRKEEHNLSYSIEVDGGINIETCDLCKNADILVVGSFITSSENAKESLESIKEKF